MILLDGKSLTRDQVLAVALEEASIDVSPEALERVDASAAYVQSLVNEGRRVYGVTTGFGPNAAVDLKDAESAQTEPETNSAPSVIRFDEMTGYQLD